MSVGESLLSKVIDANDIGVLSRFRVEPSDFPTDGERQALRFIQRYAEENRGQAPSYASVAMECADFTYIPDVSDSYEYLIRKLKESAGKRRFVEFVNTELPKWYGKVGADYTFESLISDLQSEFEHIKLGTSVRNRVGTDVKNAADSFLSEYRARQAGESFRLWRSKFSSINRAIGGGYYGGNCYTWYARSGRGKSVVVMEEGEEAAFQGANVLVWAMEMGKYEYMARLFSSVSARAGVIKAHHNGVDLDAGFETRAFLSGRLDAGFEREFDAFIHTLNDVIPGRIILRAVDDDDFRDRSLRQLEADIIDTKADIVIIDPFYYLDYEANTSKTTGGDAANTSRKLRQIAGRTGVVMHIITQADEDSKEKGEDGIRELRPPKRAEIKKTKAVLEDATNVFGIDTLAHEGRGVIEIGKGRNGGEDARVELIYLPNFGIVRELIAEDEAALFVGNF